MMRLFLQDAAGNVSGPHTMERVRERLEAGRISWNDQGREEGTDDWIVLEVFKKDIYPPHPSPFHFSSAQSAVANVMPLDLTKSDKNEKAQRRVAVVLFFIACIFLTHANGRPASFVGVCALSAVPAIVIFALWRKMEGSPEYRLALCGLTLAGLAFVGDGLQKSSAEREAKAKAAAESAQRYLYWYRSLPPYLRALEDNRLLLQENAELRAMLRSREP